MDQQTEKNLLDLVKRNYEEIAADFDNTRKKELWPELIKLTEQVRAGNKVLDVGCGNGRLARAFLGQDIKYLGVDNSEQLIELAEKQYNSGISNFPASPARFARKAKRGEQFPISKQILNYNNQTNTKYKIQDTRFIAGDILELDKLPEKDFDYIFCLAVLHHLPGENLRIQALKQMKNKINNHGKIIVTVWNLWPQAKFRRLIFKYGLLKLIGKNKMDWGDILFDWKNNQGRPVSRRYYHVFTENGLKKLAGRAGLKIKKLYKDSDNYYFILRKYP